MEIKLYGHLGVNITVIKEPEGRSTFPTLLTKACECLANVALDGEEGKIGAEKRV